ncbi:hypothetical protein [Pseudoxanthomonas sp. SE1]|uniref:hypothetical protein n=1 Tax=Pseudoxanthomonas sp. SE1 TaxID=1664560 RepID=UPI00240E8CFD|nr:hypothetical protein [Pseudoxanthomonas sp. SE1]WFC40548.1 hypothetical protein OY559_12020 [Pseudoxanthomonas sp. SE1]
MSIVNQFLASPWLIGFAIALFVSSSITTLDKRIVQAKKSGVLPPDHQNLPTWFGALHILDWILLIALLILNWRVGLAIWVIIFALKVLPVLETIGNVLMRPFRRA